MKKSFFVICILILSIAFIPKTFAHEPNFGIDPKTPEDILKMCHFFYEEYQMIGSENFKDHHKLFLHAKICPILYENIAWKSKHPQKDIVLIFEIEKKLDENSNYLKNKHLGKISSVPKWFENKAKLWIDGQIKNKEFLNAIEEISDSNLIKQEEIKYKRICNTGISCLKEKDFLEYTYTNNQGEKTEIRFDILEVNSDEISIGIKSKNNVKEEYKKIQLDTNGKISDNFECCYFDKLFYIIPSYGGGTIQDDFQVFERTDYVLDTEIRNAFLAQNQEGQIIEIDKETGVMLSLRDTNEIESKNFEIILTNTSIFENTLFTESNHITIPEWFKENTKWYLDETISEKEFLNSIKYLNESR
ncbi:hypothetical protein BD31_I1100 [Candidatus Nitrosopumilus salaria BD31]|uniref:Uncharacterized protein n=1 Tax=Candidatus Nitrosopumilus salarius BD31 TaxID=859350 RepID=I3D4M3_9ARCH|nr:hypothetical protein [Candidatus Nitrosopumilus salaria]EIJ66666.1 hypothetical protein BD31_I1100 [Candidatus Nitrosopumilus salaria BD31]